MEGLYIHLLVCVLFSLVFTCECKNEQELQTDLLKDYNINVIPQRHRQTPVEVFIVLNLRKITYIDEKAEVIGTNSWLSVTWTDENLKWEPAQYENITSIYMQQKQIWLPDLIITNAQDEIVKIGYDSLNVIIDNKGSIAWKPPLSLSTVCEIDTTYFPFDVQTCTVTISAWSHLATRVKLLALANKINLIPYAPNSQWDITDTNASIKVTGRSLRLLKIKMKLQRRFEYYITSMMVPVMLMALLSCFVFLLPTQSGEKASFGITVFLAFMVLMTFIMQDLPKTSKTTSIFVIYIGGLLGLGFLSVLWSVISHLNSKNSESSPANNETTKGMQTADGYRMRDLRSSEPDDDYSLTDDGKPSATCKCSSPRSGLSTVDLVMFAVVSCVMIVSTIVVIYLLKEGQAKALATEMS